MRWGRRARARGSSPAGPERVARVGIITGGAGNMIGAAHDAGLDTFITGEGAHYTYFDAIEWGLNVVFAGHYATETLGVQALASHLAERFELEWEFHDHPTGSVTAPPALDAPRHPQALRLRAGTARGRFHADARRAARTPGRERRRQDHPDARGLRAAFARMPGRSAIDGVAAHDRLAQDRAPPRDRDGASALHVGTRADRRRERGAGRRVGRCGPVHSGSGCASWPSGSGCRSTPTRRRAASRSL